MLHSLDARRGRLLTNSLYTQTSGAELHQIKLAHSMRVHPSDSLSLQPVKSPLQRSSPAGSSRVGPLLQVPSRDIRTSGHASRRVHKTTFPQPTPARLVSLLSYGFQHFACSQAHSRQVWLGLCLVRRMKPLGEAFPSLALELSRALREGG